MLLRVFGSNTLWPAPPLAFNTAKMTRVARLGETTKRKHSEECAQKRTIPSALLVRYSPAKLVMRKRSLSALCSTTARLSYISIVSFSCCTVYLNECHIDVPLKQNDLKHAEKTLGAS